MKDAARPVPLAIIIGLACLLWGSEYLCRDLWEPDEARYAYVANEMRQDGHWLVPHRHGIYYAHKPPLMFWLQNAAATVTDGSVNRISARLPSLLGAILSLWAASRLVLLWGGDAGISRRVVCILPTTYLFWNVNSMGQIDALLCGLQMTGLYLLFKADTASVRAARLQRLGAYTAMGLAVIAKGPVGYLVPFGAYVAVQLATRNARNLRRLHLLWGLAVALAPAALWLGTVWLRHPPPGYLREILFAQNVGRAAGTTIRGHHRSFTYFLWHFPLEFMPWTILLPAAFLATGRDEHARLLRRRTLTWALFVIAFFSLSVTKRNLYVMMAYPAAAMLIAAAWPGVATLSRRTQCASGYTISALLGLLGLVGTVAPLAPRVPLGLAVTVPIGILLVTGAVMLARHCHRAGLSTQWFYGLFVLMFSVQILAATTLMPALNPLKVPYALADAAKTQLPPGHELLLYRIHGEIQALYCHARGKQVETVYELRREIKRQRKGIVVVQLQQWDELKNEPALKGRERTYRMGNKTMLYIPFDITTPTATR